MGLPRTPEPRSRLAVVNDDLTGCNVTGSLFVGRGLPVLSLVDPADTWLRSAPADAVLMVNTDSRTLPPAVAYAQVQAIARQVEAAGVRLIGKRIDSALRGNLGPEVDAVLDLRGPDSLAIISPSVPSDGRATVGGHLLFGGIPLPRAEVAASPGVPATSFVPAVVAGQTRRPVGRIDLADIQAGPNAVATRLREEAELGNRVVVVDCVTTGDAEAIAEGILLAPFDVLSADAGPISAELAYRLLSREPRLPIFLVVGSRSPLTAAQLVEARRNLTTNLIAVEPEDALAGAERLGAAADRAIRQLIAGSAETEAIGIVVSMGSPATADDRPAIARGLAEIARRALAEARLPIGGLFLSGGDTAVEVCRALGIQAIEVRGHVAPLRPHGRALGGPLHGLPIVTKGGTVGAREAVVESIRFLQRAISQQPPAATPQPSGWSPESPR